MPFRVLYKSNSDWQHYLVRLSWIFQAWYSDYSTHRNCSWVDTVPQSMGQSLSHNHLLTSQKTASSTLVPFVHSPNNAHHNSHGRLQNWSPSLHLQATDVTGILVSMVHSDHPFSMIVPNQYICYPSPSQRSRQYPYHCRKRWNQLSNPYLLNRGSGRVHRDWLFEG